LEKKKKEKIGARERGARCPKKILTDLCPPVTDLGMRKKIGLLGSTDGAGRTRSQNSLQNNDEHRFEFGKEEGAGQENAVREGSLEKRGKGRTDAEAWGNKNFRTEKNRNRTGGGHNPGEQHRKKRFSETRAAKTSK